MKAVNYELLELKVTLNEKRLKANRSYSTLWKERPHKLMFTQTYINHCSFKLIQSLAQLALGQLHNVTASETELAMIKKNAWNNSSITVEDLLGNSVSRFVQSGAWSWNQSEHRIFNFCTFRSTFFSRSQCETLLCPASNQTFDFRTNERTVFLQSSIKVAS